MSWGLHRRLRPDYPPHADQTGAIPDQNVSGNSRMADPLTSDLVAKHDGVWRELGFVRPRPFDEQVGSALRSPMRTASGHLGAGACF